MTNAVPIVANTNEQIMIVKLINFSFDFLMTAAETTGNFVLKKKRIK